MQSRYKFDKSNKHEKEEIFTASSTHTHVCQGELWETECACFQVIHVIWSTFITRTLASGIASERASTSVINRPFPDQNEFFFLFFFFLPNLFFAFLCAALHNKRLAYSTDKRAAKCSLDSTFRDITQEYMNRHALITFSYFLAESIYGSEPFIFYIYLKSYVPHCPCIRWGFLLTVFWRFAIVLGSYSRAGSNVQLKNKK